MRSCIRMLFSLPVAMAFLGLGGAPDRRGWVIARDYGAQISHPTRRSKRMTEALNGAQLEEALAVIDRGLGDMMRRDLVATAEVADLLLDLRSLLTFVPADPAVEPAGVNERNTRRAAAPSAGPTSAPPTTSEA